MKNENFAERLFCDLRNNGIILEPAQYVMEGAKIGQFPNSKQFNIFGVRDKYSFNKGIVGNQGQLTFTEAYQQLLTNLLNMGNNLKFYSLVVPAKGCEVARLEEFEKVVTRYVKDYMPGLDEMAERWDIMIGPA